MIPAPLVAGAHVRALRGALLHTSAFARSAPADLAEAFGGGGPAPRDTIAAPVVIRLNGEPHVLDAPLTIAELLERLRIDPRRVAVERNLFVVKRALYGETTITEGDEIEIVNFVGGG